jgi:hypothetical protein
MERKRVLNLKYTCQLVKRILRKRSLRCLKINAKDGSQNEHSKSPNTNFQQAGAEAPHFRPEVPRFCPEVPYFSRRLRVVQKQQHEPRKNRSKLVQNNSD